jgi:hypothetical protein
MNLILFMLLGIVLAILASGVYKLVRRNGFTFEVGGNLKFSFGSARNGALAHIPDPDQLAVSRQPELGAGRGMSAESQETEDPQ